MDENVRAWLRDILDAIGEIDEFTSGQKDFFKFQKDLKTKRAVERNIEIIGEAMSRILRSNPAFKISNSRKIVDTRNRVIHGYDAVSDDIVWGIVVRELPKLRAEIYHLLRN